MNQAKKENAKIILERDEYKLKKELTAATLKEKIQIMMKLKEDLNEKTTTSSLQAQEIQTIENQIINLENVYHQLADEQEESNHTQSSQANESIQIKTEHSNANNKETTTLSPSLSLSPTRNRNVTTALSTPPRAITVPIINLTVKPQDVKYTEMKPKERAKIQGINGDLIINCYDTAETEKLIGDFCHLDRETPIKEVADSFNDLNLINRMGLPGVTVVSLVATTDGSTADAMGRNNNVVPQQCDDNDALCKCIALITGGKISITTYWELLAKRVPSPIPISNPNNLELLNLNLITFDQCNHFMTIFCHGIKMITQSF